jgi:thiol-disulfide isomerase/thioredoxin
MVSIAVVLIAAFGSAGIGGCPDSDIPAAVQNPGPANQQLQFAAKTVDGRDFSGQSLAGKPAVLWFWVPWRPICRSEAPSVERIAHSTASVTFVGVPSRTGPPCAKLLSAQR